MQPYADLLPGIGRIPKKKESLTGALFRCSNAAVEPTVPM